MGMVCVVDRSLIFPGTDPEVLERRNRVVTHFADAHGSPDETYIAYSEVARTTSLSEATEQGHDYFYGSNLQHALVLARVACRAHQCDRIRLVTYSLPSACHIGGVPYFNYPPGPATLEAAEREAVNSRSDGFRIDVDVICESPERGPEADVVVYFRSLAETAGGALRLS